MKKKMKKWFLLLFVVAAMTGMIQISSTAAGKKSGTCGDNLTWVLDEKGTLTISGTGKMEDYEYWESAWGCDYDYADEIVSIVIEKGVTTVGNYAFCELQNLANVQLNDGLVSIGDGAFEGCWQLSKINLPSSIIAIGKSAFSCCNLTSIEIPAKVTSIEEDTFLYCDKLTNVSIPSDVTSIGEYAFACSGLTSIEIPSKVTRIENGTFLGCGKLTNITIPSNVTAIGKEAFRDCSSLEKVIVQGENQNYSSKDGVLFNKDKTIIIYYPNGKSGESYTIPSGVKTIAKYAFGSNEFLKSLTIPASVTTVESSSLGDSWGEYCLSTIRFMGGMPELKSGFLADFMTGTIYYPNTWESVPDMDDFVDPEGGHVECVPYKVKGTFDEPKLSSVSNAAKGVTVKWGKVSGAAKYRVLRKTGSGDWKKVGDTTSTSYTDTTVKSGTTYSYTVRCISSDGKSNTSSYNTTGKSIKYIAQPALSSVSNTAKGVTVKWSKVTGAAKYRVLRKTGSGSWTKVGNTTSTSYTDTTAKSGTTYTYTVRCISSDGKTYTSSYNTTGKSIKYLSRPKVSSASNTSTGVTVKWGKVTGASGYYVYRKTSSGSYSKIATIKSGSTVSYKDTAVKAKNGTKYIYMVKAYSGKTVSSAASGKIIVRLTSSSISSLKNYATKKMTVKWAQNSKVTGYQVQYSTSSKFSSTTTKTITGYKNVSKTITSLTKGKTYYVRVRGYKTVSGVKYYSAWSAVKSVKISK